MNVEPTGDGSRWGKIGVTLCEFVLRKARNVRNSGMGSMSCWSAPKMVQYQIWSLPNMVINPRSMKITAILTDSLEN